MYSSVPTIVPNCENGPLGQFCSVVLGHAEVDHLGTGLRQSVIITLEGLDVAVDDPLVGVLDRLATGTNSSRRWRGVSGYRRSTW